MIRFDFTVSDEEADTIMEAMDSELSRCSEYKTNSYDDNDMDKYHWFNNRIIYLQNLMRKMENYRVEDQ